MIDDQPRPLAAKSACTVMPCALAMALRVSPGWTVYVPDAATGAAGAAAQPARPAPAGRGGGAAPGDLQRLAGVDDRRPAEPVRCEERLHRDRRGSLRDGAEACRRAGSCRSRMPRPARREAAASRGSAVTVPVSRSTWPGLDDRVRRQSVDRQDVGRPQSVPHRDAEDGVAARDRVGWREPRRMPAPAGARRPR